VRLIERFGGFGYVLAWPALLRGLPRYARDWRALRSGGERFALDDIQPALLDWGAHAGAVGGDYFHQDFWAARRVHAEAPALHVDIGSRVDGFVTHVASFRRIIYADVRPLPTMPNITPLRGSLLALPFADRGVPSLSCLHVVEHIGLGRYGDPITPNGHLIAMRELARVAGRDLYFSVPMGRERTCFNAHRVIAPQTILNEFADFGLIASAVVDDGGSLHDGADARTFADANYACGLFHFRRRVT
jgi:hypothetical protein